MGCVFSITSLVSTVLMDCVDESVRKGIKLGIILKVNATSEHLQCELTGMPRNQGIYSQ